MHAHQLQFWLYFYGGLLGLLLGGCATNVGNTVKVSEVQIAKYDNLSAADSISTLENNINAAKGDNMNFLAPQYLKEASEILARVQKSSSKISKNELVGEIAKGDAILDKGRTIMSIVQDLLANELKLKKLLDKYSAAKVYPKEYESSVSSLSALITKVELEKAEDINSDKIALLKSMQALAVKVIKYTALRESNLINEDLKSKNAAMLAPVVFAEALRVYQDAENRIEIAPDDESAVQSASEDALFAARHARQINQRVLALQSQLKVSVEAIARQEEENLLGVSTALGHKDIRDLPIEKQAEAIARAAAEAAHSKKILEQNLESANSNIQSMEKQLKEASMALQQANASIPQKTAQPAQAAEEKDVQTVPSAVTAETQPDQTTEATDASAEVKSNP